MIHAKDLKIQLKVNFLFWIMFEVLFKANI
jgi:hypothetical protein